MSNDRVDHHAFRVALIFLLLLTIGTIVVGELLDFDKEVLVSLKIFLEDQNHMNRGRFSDWNQPRTPPCAWPGISCFGDRVTGIDLSGSEISGGMFGNFSAFTALTHLNLSGNTISGEIPADLGGARA
ncbi:probable LRR receptor-like serine/threonine-protein kinase At1g74360 [Camellia sinensis]|uniref:probable LRR receptor-like serine/threonine-protein kinase At1g74360 n=1 Tax=Camellia sinensis TaxID=4442 RepID=UPI001036C385|nr:probable LRR receptor-like serine/threonine-protein kinase At1g74360 [Camellia sinensis]